VRTKQRDEFAWHQYTAGCITSDASHLERRVFRLPEAHWAPSSCAALLPRSGQKQVRLDRGAVLGVEETASTCLALTRDAVDLPYEVNRIEFAGVAIPDEFGGLTIKKPPCTVRLTIYFQRLQLD
jgi:hypothetical protein